MTALLVTVDLSAALLVGADVDQLLARVDAGQLLATEDIEQQLATVDAGHLLATEDIQPSVVSIEVANIVRVSVDEWPDRVPVTYEGELVTFEGEPLWLPGTAGMADLTTLGAVLQQLTEPYERRTVTLSNKGMPCRVTAHDGDLACDIAIARKPAPGAFITVVVSSWTITDVGNGTRVGCVCYFSGDGGLTARAWGAVQVGDTVHWNGSIAGAELDAADEMSLIFEEGT